MDTLIDEVMGFHNTVSLIDNVNIKRSGAISGDAPLFLQSRGFIYSFINVL